MIPMSSEQRELVKSIVDRALDDREREKAQEEHQEWRVSNARKEGLIMGIMISFVVGITGAFFIFEVWPTL